MFDLIKNLFSKKPECYAVPWDDDTPVLPEVKNIQRVFDCLPSAKQFAKGLKVIASAGFKISDFTKKRST